MLAGNEVRVPPKLTILKSYGWRNQLFSTIIHMGIPANLVLGKCMENIYKSKANGSTKRKALLLSKCAKLFSLRGKEVRERKLGILCQKSKYNIKNFRREKRIGQKEVNSLSKRSSKVEPVAPPKEKKK